MSGKRALILGCGYTGLALARALRTLGAEVIATTRHPDRFEEIESTGAQARLAEVMDRSTLRALADFSPHVVFDLVRPQRRADGAYTSEGTQNIGATFARSGLEALIYVSSTSVYGRRSGEWTDEATPVDPVSPLAVARVEAERVYLDRFAREGMPIRICRVPGIYGPDRTLRQRLETGAYRRLDDEKLWVSRIHVEDLATGLIAAWRRGASGEIYLLSDDEPVTAQEYAELTASLLSLPLPPVVARDDIRQELSSDAFERRISSRRCRNQRMRAELGVELQYPTVREGIPASLRQEGVLESNGP